MNKDNMHEEDTTPKIDPFGTIDNDLEEFRNTAESKEKIVIDPADVKKVSEEHNFTSRGNASIKEKTHPKTFSLFQHECGIINSALASVMNENDSGLKRVSGSDVVRAALYLFGEKTPESQVELIKKYRGRGRT